MTSSRACVFINSNNPRARNRLINTISCIKPPFPPDINLSELIAKQSFVDKSSGRSPNAFIIYRKAYVEAARKDGYQLPMTVVSSMASASWELEPQEVKEEYRRLAKEANSIRNKLIPKNKRKRQKWNIVSFPTPPTAPPKASTTTVKNKTKPLIKKKKVEISTTTNHIPPVTFHIPYDICSKIEDRYKSDESDDTITFDNPYPTTNSDFNLNLNDFNDFNNFNNFNNYIPQIDDIPIIEPFVDVPVDIPVIDINNEFDSFGFPTFFNEHEVYPPPFCGF